jgi:hypothetical protein
METEMKTHTIQWTPIDTRDSRIVLQSPRPLRAVLGLASGLLLAAAVALTILTGAAWWVTQPELVIYLQALTWAGGFVFVALAVESEGPRTALLNLATGVALPLLAWLSAHLAVELAIVAAALVAAWAASWIAAALFRRQQ